ncbi:MAG: hypothetical protein WB561_14165 [Terracidiphilus sp.]
MMVRSVGNSVKVGVAGVVLGATLLGWTQYGPSGGQLGNAPGNRPQNGVGMGPETDPQWGDKRLNAMNADRHKSMVSDTDKLLKLARQLDAEIASNPSEELTPEELHKVGEIEKLARNVKAKMAQSFGAGPQLHPSGITIGGPLQQ